MTIARDDDFGDDDDETILTVDEHIVAMKQVLYAVLNRLANAAPNPFEELATIRRLLSHDLERACLIHDRPVRPERVADEADRYIRVAESRIM